MNNDKKKQDPQQKQDQKQKQTDGVPFVPSTEPNKLEPTPEKAGEKSARR